MNKEQKENLITIIITLILSVAIYILNRVFIISEPYNWVMYLVPYILISYEMYIELFSGIFKKEGFDIFDEDFLMIVASLGAFILEDYVESIAVVFLFKIGEFFEDYAVDKSIENVKALMDIRPDHANKKVNGNLVQFDPIDIKVGDIIYVLPGERVPLDGELVEVVNGNIAKLDMSSLTGESRLVDKSINDVILSGSINKLGDNRAILKNKELDSGIIDGTLAIKVVSEFSNSTVSKILDLITSANEKKSKNEAFITKFAKVYTPIVCGLALLISIFGLVIGDFKLWVYRALTFLVISCPCALVISIPLCFFSAIGACSKRGILVKGSEYIEKLSKVNKIAFDKTGTLTVGSIVKEDRLKDNARESIDRLKKIGIRYTIMITGDSKEVALKVKDDANLDDVRFELLPDQKLTEVEKLMDKDTTLMYVGDGINDAPCLVRADIGCAMGKLGTDSSVYASDMVIMDDDLSKISKAILIARKCIRIAKENIYFSIGIKVLCMILSVLGFASMWLSILADVGVMILATLNALRTFK